LICSSATAGRGNGDCGNVRGAQIVLMRLNAKETNKNRRGERRRGSRAGKRNR